MFNQQPRPRSTLQWSDFARNVRVFQLRHRDHFTRISANYITYDLQVFFLLTVQFIKSTEDQYVDFSFYVELTNAKTGQKECRNNARTTFQKTAFTQSRLICLFHLLASIRPTSLIRLARTSIVSNALLQLADYFFFPLYHQYRRLYRDQKAHFVPICVDVLR